MRGLWWSCIERSSEATSVSDTKLDMFARIRCHSSYPLTTSCQALTKCDVGVKKYSVGGVGVLKITIIIIYTHRLYQNEHQ